MRLNWDRVQGTIAGNHSAKTLLLPRDLCYWLENSNGIYVFKFFHNSFIIWWVWLQKDLANYSAMAWQKNWPNFTIIRYKFGVNSIMLFSVRFWAIMRFCWWECQQQPRAWIPCHLRWECIAGAWKFHKVACCKSIYATFKLLWWK